MADRAEKVVLSSAWKALLAPWMTAVILMAYLWAKDLNFPDPPTARIIFWHVPMAMLGMFWFAVAAYHALRYLFGGERGNPERDARVASACELGLLCTVLATATGSVFAYRQWGTPWNWDPKQVSITVLIMVYLAYFAVRMSFEDPDLRGRVSAVYALVFLPTAPLLMYVVPNLPQVRALGSLHPPGNVISSGLDAKWRTIYWMATAGFLATTVWLFELRLRAWRLERRLSALGQAEFEGRIEAAREPALRG